MLGSGVILRSLLGARRVGGTWTAVQTWTLPAVTLGGAVSLNAQALDGGTGTCKMTSTGANMGFRAEITNAGTTGVEFLGIHNSSSPGVDDVVCRFTAIGNLNGGTPDLKYGEVSFKVETMGAGTESGKLEIWLATGGAFGNQALTLSSAGTLGVDLSGVSGTYANVDLFDEYDDALVLRQGIQQNNRELLADMGVLTRKGTGSGYMMQLQPMLRLLAGGIYQSRARIDDVASRIDQLEGELVGLKALGAIQALQAEIDNLKSRLVSLGG